MRPFQYTSTRTVEDTLERLSNAGDSTVRALAGGTDLLTLMKVEIESPQELIDIKRLDGLPGSIVAMDDGVDLGALTTLTEIETNDVIRERYPLLSEAAGLAATPQLRNRATLAGNLLQRPRCWYFRSPHFHCWLQGGSDCPARDGENQFHAIFDESPCVAVHPSDLAGCLMALDATIEVHSVEGDRTLQMADFFTMPTDTHRRETAIESGELIFSVHLPTLPNGARSTYRKSMDRKVWAFALVGVAAVVAMEGAHIKDARLVLNGVAPIPWRAEAAEQMLIGESPGTELFNQVADVALSGAEPLAHNGYKVELARRLIRQALAALTS